MRTLYQVIVDSQRTQTAKKEHQRGVTQTHTKYVNSNAKRSKQTQKPNDFYQTSDFVCILVKAKAFSRKCFQFQHCNEPFKREDLILHIFEELCNRECYLETKQRKRNKPIYTEALIEYVGIAEF